MVPEPLVLASASPQRRAILEQLGIDFVVAPAGVEELATGDPIEVARENARRKAEGCLTDSPGLVVRQILGVDTVVTLDGELFGKPVDEADARATLARLAGRTHTVISGVALATGGEVRLEHVATGVTMRALDAAEIAGYVATGEWRGRAGGYAIQGRGAWLVEAITGDYLNVVGLPVQALRRLLSAA